MRSEHVFVGRTAARLWGLPLGSMWKKAEPLEVAVPVHLSPPRTARVHGRRLAQWKIRSWTVAGARVVDAVTALFTCAPELTLTQAVVMVDALITAADNYRGLMSTTPLSSIDEIAERMREWGRFPGCRTVRDALALAREGVESPKETETRLLLVDGGLPEPSVQHEVRDGGRFIARVDLAYPQLKIAIEYEGDGHRTDKAQWRIDIQRQRELEGLGWIVIRLTESDLSDGGTKFLTCVRGAIVSRKA